MAENVVTVRPITEREQFMIDCRAMNKTFEDCERESLRFIEKQPIIVNRVVMQPLWYNPIGLAIIVGIAAIIGYGIFVTLRHFRNRNQNS
jgi:hypothetical protein